MIIYYDCAKAQQSSDKIARQTWTKRFLYEQLARKFNNPWRTGILFKQPHISSYFETRQRDTLDKRYDSTSQARTTEEDSSPPVPCETNPTGQNGVVVYDDTTYPLISASSVRSSAAVGGGLQRHWSFEEIHHQEENLAFQPCGHLTSAGRYNPELSQCPVCLGEAQHTATVLRSNEANDDGNEENFFRWSRSVPRVLIVLTAVILLIIFS
ncbi:uncharacterized protein LOC121614812 [Chelmon rostratus]|uniref:uncharacterized protein LOC121614812 n=1 Tax=Chelmon rostratus TaxID=109905 RepID=UPI001BE9A5F4|nr:uncharacterized protein LOC121614812 [Chelmon rostratus]